MVNRGIGVFVISFTLLFAVTNHSAAGGAQNKKASHSPAANSDSGLQLYKRYCAVCHGNDLKGNGPVSPEFTNPPADLTTLSQRHGGEFPDTYIQDILRNGVKKTAHGNTEMPVWGPIFGSTNGANPQLVNIRIVNLTNYIKSLQAK
jgi:mono/diheme cytochrome c family protein